MNKDKTLEVSFHAIIITFRFVLCVVLRLLPFVRSFTKYFVAKDLPWPRKLCRIEPANFNRPKFWTDAGGEHKALPGLSLVWAKCSGLSDTTKIFQYPFISLKSVQSSTCSLCDVTNTSSIWLPLVYSSMYLFIIRLQYRGLIYCQQNG